MKINSKWLLLALVLMLSAAFLVPSVHATGIDGGYVGTATCLGCHDGSPASDKTSFTQTGHPWKYRDTGGGAPDALSALFPTIKGNDIDTATLGDACGLGLIICDASLNLDWSAINYAVGGFGWKIRWGVKDPTDAKTGYLWTSYGTGSVEIQGDGVGDDDGVCEAGENCKTNTTAAQYNIENGSWSAYNGGKDKKYECAVCHNTNGIVSTTGYACVTDGGTNASPARTEPWASNPGMGPEAATRGGYYSSWTFNGVQCEACHGPGSNGGNSGHADTGAGTQGVLTLAGGVQICAKCHIRAENAAGQSAECGGDSLASALTNGAKSASDFINHHEQYNELVGLNGDGKHASLSCTTCHDPHKRAAGVIPGVAGVLGIGGDPSQAAAGAIRVTCESCHAEKDADGGLNIAGHATITCIDCHMGEATKSATSSVGAQGWGRKGDVKSHIFAINPAGNSLTRSNGFTNIAVNALPVNYSCGKCHDLGSAKDLTLAQAQTAAAGYHNAVTSRDGGYIGTVACLSCHTDKQEFLKSGHPWKYKHTGGAAPADPISNLFPRIKAAQIDTATLGDGACGTGLIVCDPDGETLAWSAINYTVGGFGWKIRWGVKDPSDLKTGYLWTSSASSPTGAQHNVENGSWSNYNGNKDKKYECAVCHNTNGIVSTTGYACATDGGTNAAPARTEPWASNLGMGPEAATRGGYYSSWTFDGVQCEACHGPGNGHNYNAQPILETAPGVDICAKCHIRAENANGQSAECGGDSLASARTSGAKITDPWIGHHEQYNELVGLNDGVHKTLSCADCHNPHKRATTVVPAVETALGITDNNQSAEARGAVVSCSSCHPGKTPQHNSSVTCVDCHMAEATKTATNLPTTGWGRKADLKTHIFRIDPTASSIVRNNGIEDLSKTLVANGGTCTTGCDADNDGDGVCEANETCFNVAQNYITVAYACGKCHDSSLSTYVGHPLTEAEAKTYAQQMHSGNTTPPYPVTHNNPVATGAITDNTGVTTDKTGTTSTIFTLNTTGSSADTIDGRAPKAYVNWGDGSGLVEIAVGGTTTKTYLTNGVFKVVLVVKDALGYNATWSETVQVGNVSNAIASYAFTVDGSPFNGALTCYLKQGGLTKYTKSVTSGDCAFTVKHSTNNVYDVFAYPSNGHGLCSVSASTNTTKALCDQAGSCTTGQTTKLACLNASGIWTPATWQTVFTAPGVNVSSTSSQPFTIY